MQKSPDESPDAAEMATGAAASPKIVSQEATVDLASNTPRIETHDTTVRMQAQTPAPAAEDLTQSSPLDEATPKGAIADPDVTLGLDGRPAVAADDDRTVGFVEGEAGGDQGKTSTGKPGAPTFHSPARPVADDQTGAWTGEPDQTGAWESKPKTRAAVGSQTEALSMGTYRQDTEGPHVPGAVKELRGKVAGYEILGELGRGGMGVVYKARQIGLNRIVALKMVLSGDHASPEQLARFRIEGEAVAHLQHPNIVQVYEVGEQDGCPFFSLEYIDGPSLAKKIDSTPQPHREAAQMVQSLAEAMHAAHQRGIIHRDLKPANVLLTQDGVPKITDFGLAKRFEDKDEGHTRTGAVMGTPSYMSPEQAQGRTKDTGPPADIYSLGALLYDLLTGRPPFRGTTLLDTLQQVQSVEPVSPTRLQPNVPRDLETICLKALSKFPHKRYDTAGALAEDLRRYLAGEPILARPTPWWERGLKWARRRPAMASLIGVSTLAAVSFLVLGGLWLDSERRSAEDREVAAQERERQAEERELEQTEQAKKERALRQEVEKNFQRAERNFLRAKQAVDFTLSQVGQERLAHLPHMQAIRRELLVEALDFYKRLQEEKSTDPAIRWDVGRAQQRVADIYRLLGLPAYAEKAYESALAYFSELATEFPQRLEYRKSLAGGLESFGTLLKEIKKNQKAEEMYRRTMTLRKELAKAAPHQDEYQQKLAESFNNLGMILQILGKNKEAGPAYREGIDVLHKLAAKFPKNWHLRAELARALNNQGALFKTLGKATAAEENFFEAKSLLQDLVKQAAAIPDYRQQLAQTFKHLGDLWRDTKVKQAEEAYTKALELRAELARDFATVPRYREEWADTYGYLAVLLQVTGRQKLADNAFAEGLDIQAQTAAAFPDLPDLRRKLGSLYHNRGNLLLNQQRFKDGDDAFQKALTIFTKLDAEFPDDPVYQQALAGVYLDLVTLYQVTNRSRDAEDATVKTLKIRQDLAAKFSTVPEHQQELARTYLMLGTLQQMYKHMPQAEKFYADAVDLFTKLAAQDPNNPEYRDLLASTYNNQGYLHRDLGRTKQAEKSWSESRALLAQLARDHPGVPRYREEQGRHLNELGVYLLLAKRLKEAAAAWDEALDIQQELLDQFSERPDMRLALAKTHNNIGNLHVRTDQAAKAAASFGRAVALLEEWEPKLAVTPDYTGELIGFYRNLAKMQAALNRPADVEKSMFRILALEEKLAQTFPLAPQYRYQVSTSLIEISTRLMQDERFAAARPLLLAAVDHLKAALKINDKDAFARQTLHVTYLNLAAAFVGLEDHRQAAKAVVQAAPFTPADRPLFHNAAAYLARCASLAQKDKKLPAAEAKGLAKSYSDQAMELLNKAVGKGFKDVKFLKTSEDFESLRPRADFQKLLRDLDAKAAGAGRSPARKLDYLATSRRVFVSQRM